MKTGTLTPVQEISVAPPFLPLYDVGISGYSSSSPRASSLLTREDEMGKRALPFSRAPLPLPSSSLLRAKIAEGLAHRQASQSFAMPPGFSGQESNPIQLLDGRLLSQSRCGCTTLWGIGSFKGTTGPSIGVVARPDDSVSGARTAAFPGHPGIKCSRFSFALPDP